MAILDWLKLEFVSTSYYVSAKS